MSKINVSNVDYKSVKKEITRIYNIVNNSKKQLTDARSYLLYYSPEVQSMYSSEFSSALNEYNNLLDKIGRIERYIQTVDDSLSDTESELRKLIGGFGSTLKGALSPVKKATSTTVKKVASKNLIFSKILENISKVTNNGSKKIKLATANFSNALNVLKLVNSNTKELSANSYFNPISEKNILDYLRNNNDDFINEFKKTEYGKAAYNNINNDNYVLNAYYKFLGIDKKYGEASYKIWIMNNAAELSNYNEEDLWTIYCSSIMNTKVQYSQLEKDYANSSKDFKNYESQIINMLRNDTSGTFDDIKTSMIFKKKNSFDLISGGAFKTDVNSEISKLSDEELIKLFYKYLDADKKNFNPDLRDSSGNKLTGDKYYIALEQAWIKHCDNLIQHKMYDKMVRKEKAKAQKEFDELPFLQKALSTAAVGGEKLVSGIMQAGEELADGVYVGEGFLVKHIGNFITGDDKWGEHVDKIVQRNVGTESVGFLEDSLYDSDFGKYLNKTSYIDKDGQVAGVLNTIGNMAGKITLTSAFSGGLAKSGFAQAKGLSSAMASGGDTIYKLTKSGEVASKFVSAGYFFTSEVGSGFEKATIEGANYSDAFSYSMVNGVVNGAADFALGQAFESGSFKDILTSAGSGFVEPFITSTAKHEIYAQDKSLLDVFEEDGTLNNAVMGAAMGVVMPGLGGKFSNILDTSVFFKDKGGANKIKNIANANGSVKINNKVDVDVKSKTKVSDNVSKMKNDASISKLIEYKNKRDVAINFLDGKQYLYSFIDDVIKNNPVNNDLVSKLESFKKMDVCQIDSKELLNILKPYLSKTEVKMANQMLSRNNINKKYTDKERFIVQSFTKYAGFAIDDHLRGIDTIQNGKLQIKSSDKTAVNAYLKSVEATIDANNSVFDPKYKWHTDSYTFDDYCNTLDSLIEKSVVNTGFKCYRGIGDLFDNNIKLDVSTLKPGMTFSDSAYTSASLLNNTNSSFSYKKIQLEIDVDAGSHAAYLESITGVTDYKQQEVLLGRNSKFEITGYPRVVSDDKGERVIIPCKLIN